MPLSPSQESVHLYYWPFERRHTNAVIASLHFDAERQSGPDLKGGGKLGSCPRASTTKGPPQKNSKKYYPRKHKNTF